LYELARAGITVERTPRRVTVHHLVASDFAPGSRPEATLHVSCGGGTYVRTLCADIGQALGVGGHMKTLVRHAVGAFRIEDALPLDDLSPETAPAALLPMERALGLPTIAVCDAESERLGRGQTVTAPPNLSLSPDEMPIALLHQGRLRALARLADGVLNPFKVFEASREP
jgi:tRNA pseudouridine55 synthase